MRHLSLPRYTLAVHPTDGAIREVSYSEVQDYFVEAV